VVLEDFIELLAILKLDSLGASPHPIEEKLGQRLANRILLRADFDIVGPVATTPMTRAFAARATGLPDDTSNIRTVENCEGSVTFSMSGDRTIV
jgi:hypothetical protein